jgi:hypothetical protein
MLGAGEGNRTLVCSLGSCRSAIELRPRSNKISHLEETAVNFICHFFVTHRQGIASPHAMPLLYQLETPDSNCLRKQRKCSVATPARPAH